MEKFKDITYILLGTFITALALNIFFIPNNISSGGASGLSIILNYLFKFPVGIMVFVLNLPLFIVAILKLGLKFTFRALVGTAALSIFIDFTSGISRYEIFNVGSDFVLGSVFGGLLMGVGLSIVFKGKASTRRLWTISANSI